jgi:hypothetical protein
VTKATLRIIGLGVAFAGSLGSALANPEGSTSLQAKPATVSGVECARIAQVRPPVAAELLCSGVAVASEPDLESCLPPGIALSELVSQGLTVEARLAQLGARCKGDRLVDVSSREIRFYRLTGCWGNPPAGYPRLLERQRVELDELKRQYSVIEISCNPSGQPIQ